MDRIVGHLFRKYAFAGVLITLGVVAGVEIARRQHLEEFPEREAKKDAAPAPLAEAAPAVAAPDSPPPREESKLVDRPAEADRQGKPAPIIVERLGARRVSCAAACALEEQCGFRAASECTANSCEGDLRKLSRSDFALEGMADCAALAESPCEEACWKRGECTGAHEADAQCTAACRTLVKQAPRESYRESRCVIERSCVDLPLCAERG